MSAFPPVPRVEGIAAPMLRANIDTDQIIPSREIKGVAKTGLAPGLFAAERYLSGREPDPAFVLNRAPYSRASILLGGANFGCGSSREHAVWALHEWGVRAVAAESFAPIFFANCTRNGIVPAAVGSGVADIAAWVEADPVNQRVRVDTLAGVVEADRAYPFDLPEEARAMLAEGLDGIALTLKHLPAIEAWEARDRAARPWLWSRAA